MLFTIHRGEEEYIWKLNSLRLCYERLFKTIWTDVKKSHIRPKRFILKMNPVISSAFFSTMKRKLGKEKSPADEKLPEILSQWQQKSQLLTRFARSSDRWFLLTPLLRISYRQFFTCGIVFKKQIISLILNHIIYIIINRKLFWTVLYNLIPG